MNLFCMQIQQSINHYGQEVYEDKSYETGITSALQILMILGLIAGAANYIYLSNKIFM